MNKLDDLLTIPTACLIIFLVALTMLTRRFVESFWPELSTKTPVTTRQRLWELFILPAIPAVLGMTFCLIVPASVWPYYPSVASATRLSLGIYGWALGWLSASAYQQISNVLKKKWNVELPGATGNTPAPPADLPTASPPGK
jgi:hypothetical protein